MPITTSESVPQPAQQQGADPRLGGGSRAGTKAPENANYQLDPRLAALVQAALELAGEYEGSVGRTVVPVVLVKDISKNTTDATRTGPPYRVISVDLSVARNDLQPVAGTVDLVMSGVTISALTPGASLRLAIGERDGILIGGNGLPVGTAIDFEVPEQIKLRISNAAQPAATVELLVGVGGVTA
jgi:hypothetical protein